MMILHVRLCEGVPSGLIGPNQHTGIGIKALHLRVTLCRRSVIVIVWAYPDFVSRYHCISPRLV